MRNVLEEISREKTHFIFNNIFAKIVPFVRKCGKIW